MRLKLIGDDNGARGVSGIQMSVHLPPPQGSRLGLKIFEATGLAFAQADEEVVNGTSRSVLYVDIPTELPSGVTVAEGDTLIATGEVADFSSGILGHATGLVVA